MVSDVKYIRDKLPTMVQCQPGAAEEALLYKLGLSSAPALYANNFAGRVRSASWEGPAWHTVT